MKESMSVKDLDSMWNLENEDEEAENTEGKESAWDLESGWVKDAHLLSLDEIRKQGYPNEGGGQDEKLLGKTGLGLSPNGLILIWRDIALAWDISVAKLQRITTSHGLCIYAHDPWYTDTYKVYKDSMKIARGMDDPSYIRDLTSSFLLYKFHIPSAKTGGSISFLKNRLGMIGQVNAVMGVAEATTLIELSVTSIMTLESKELGKWKKTLTREYENFREFGSIRKRLLEDWYEKHKV